MLGMEWITHGVSTIDPLSTSFRDRMQMCQLPNRIATTLTVFQTAITQLIGRDELELFAYTRAKTA